ncbi:hypothetical protein Mchl_5658 (plasmid) [Methylorubrum extorquens CM4]|uniref:Uncharacterized protein n=2 Tax=Methylorubrum extorquens TaxID=408 RepID=B7L3H3_METC4|nr:hypothetical protein Mchl_5658 [Methylorubrum extorquens CM4]
MSVSLEKRIPVGTWRSVGLRVQGLTTAEISIGGSSIRAISVQTKGIPYRVGRIDPRNAFVIDCSPLRLLYVRPDYRGYRYAAGKVFPRTPWQVDYDHALGRQLALQLGFRYVLLLRVAPSVNRAHGAYERPPQGGKITLHKFCFADRRIMDKWLGRRPRHGGSQSSPMRYEVGGRQVFGLTLKQAGFWGYAMGVEDGPLKLTGLTAL